MFFEYEQRARARRSGCGENGPPTPVQGQFISPRCQQAMVYAEVPVNERPSAWVLTEIYLSSKYEPTDTNGPHHPHHKNARLLQLSDDRRFARLGFVHVQPEESGAT